MVCFGQLQLMEQRCWVQDHSCAAGAAAARQRLTMPVHWHCNQQHLHASRHNGEKFACSLPLLALKQLAIFSIAISALANQALRYSHIISAGTALPSTSGADQEWWVFQHAQAYTSPDIYPKASPVLKVLTRHHARLTLQAASSRKANHEQVTTLHIPTQSLPQ